MADLAYDASDPASSEPAGIALQQANRPSSSDRGKLRVFISYSRDDLKFADQLDAALNACGFDSVIDRHGISGGEEWKPRLGSLISEADTVVFVLSPTSASSPVCAWEVEEATRLGKRILPVTCRPLEGVSPPLQLGERNYIFFYDDPKVSDSGFGTGLASLIAALNTDLDWLREHTRYLQRAMEWDAGGRPTDRLLSGNDIRAAKDWAACRPKGAPEPTALHLEFIRASEEEAEARSSAQRKQLDAMAAAQAERETALAEREEALKQAADAQRRRTKIRNIAFVVGSVLLVAASGLAAVAGFFGLRVQAQRDDANELLASITEIVWKLRTHMDNLTVSETRDLFERGALAGNEIAMNFFGIAYLHGFGLPQDSAKAHEWFDKAGAADEKTMLYLCYLYESGLGPARGDVAARDWCKRAAAKGDTGVMNKLGMLYTSGGDTRVMNKLGMLYRSGGDVAPDYVKAREWFERAAARGNESANMELEQLSINEAQMAGRSSEALQLQEALAAKVEAEETKRDGRPGPETADTLNRLALQALFAKDFTKALTVASRCHTLFPHDLFCELNRANALMFTGHDEEAKALYVANKGKPIMGGQSVLWEQVVAKDFAAFREAGSTSPILADVEKELGISR